jgi:hypothetical protein
VRRRRILSVGLIVAAIGTSSCSSHGEERYGQTPVASRPVTSQPKSGAASPTKTTESDDSRILAQYSEFWLTALPSAYSASDRDRKSALARVVDQKFLAYLLNRIAYLQAKGHNSYGFDRPITQAIERSKRNPKRALVRGCLDSSGVGVQEMKSGKKMTVGIPRNPVLVSLGCDNVGVWRISGFHFPGGQC